jgi:hypothetical protein
MLVIETKKAFKSKKLNHQILQNNGSAIFTFLWVGESLTASPIYTYKKSSKNAALLSEWSDSNGRPLAPHASTLANCATPRIVNEIQVQKYNYLLKKTAFFYLKKENFPLSDVPSILTKYTPAGVSTGKY